MVHFMFVATLAHLICLIPITSCLASASIATTSSEKTFASIGAHGIAKGEGGPDERTTVAVAAKAAVVAAAAVTKVATALQSTELLPSVREAALQAAANAAVTAFMGGSATDPAGEIPQLPQRTSSADIAAAREETAADIAAARADIAAAPMMRRETAAGLISSPTIQTVPEDMQTAAQHMPSDVPVLSQVAGQQDESVAQAAHQSGTSDQVAADSKILKSSSQYSSQEANSASLLYIGVFSEPRDFEQRARVRKGWMASLSRALPAGSSEVLAQFVIGRRPVKAYAGVQEGNLDAGSSLMQVSMEEVAKMKKREDELRKRPSIVLSDPWATPAPESPDMLLEKAVPSVDPNEVRLDAELGHEFSTHGDMLHIPYEDLPIRVLMFFAHAVETNYRFIAKVDVDQDFLFMPAIQNMRPDLSQGETLVFAAEHPFPDGHTPKKLGEADVSVLAEGSSARARGNYLGSSCYLTSRPLAERFAKTHLDHSLMLWSYGQSGRVPDISHEGMSQDDYDMGRWVAFEDELLQQGIANQDSSALGRVQYHSVELCRSSVGQSSEKFALPLDR